jgi:hypothetical protein
VCEGTPQFTAILPVKEWYWPGVSYGGHFYENSIAAPAFYRLRN